MLLIVQSVFFYPVLVVQGKVYIQYNNECKKRRGVNSSDTLMKFISFSDIKVIVTAKWCRLLNVPWRCQNSFQNTRLCPTVNQCTVFYKS